MTELRLCQNGENYSEGAWLVCWECRLVFINRCQGQDRWQGEVVSYATNGLEPLSAVGAVERRLGCKIGCPALRHAQEKGLLRRSF
jgi:hypothetical protein